MSALSIDTTAGVAPGATVARFRDLRKTFAWGVAPHLNDAPEPSRISVTDGVHAIFIDVDEAELLAAAILRAREALR